MFDPEPWQEKAHEWKGKHFIKGSIPLLFHMPFPPMVGRLMGKMWKMAEHAGKAPDKKDFLCLATDPNPWKGEYYMAVDGEVPGIENVKITGTFISKVFDGPYSAVPGWMKELNSYLSGKGKKAKNYYFHYTTCPKCAKKYGHNYVVGFAEV